MGGAQPWLKQAEQWGLANPYAVTGLEQRKRIARMLVSPMHRYSGQKEICRRLKDDSTSMIGVSGNRQTGKTTTVGLWTLAACIARSHFVVRIFAETLAGPSRNWLDKEGEEDAPLSWGALQLLKHVGLEPHVRVLKRDGSVKEIHFPWASTIYVHDAESLGAIDRKRGLVANVFWIDEAQVLDELFALVMKLIVPTLPTTNGKVVATGTPGKQVGSFFHQISGGSEDGWWSTRLFSWYNPAYGATVSARWAHVMTKAIEPNASGYHLSAGDVERLRALEEEELNAIANDTAVGELKEWADKLHPDLLRELFGRWVHEREQYVYRFNDVAPDLLYWGRAPESDTSLALAVVASLRDAWAALPLRYNGETRPWRLTVGLDIGWKPGHTAWVALAWAPGHDTIYEAHSSKAMELPDSAVFARTRDLCREARDAGFVVSDVLCDMENGRQGTLADLNSYLFEEFPELSVGLPDKHNKAARTLDFNTRLQRGKLRVLAGSDLDIEGRNLQFKPFNPARANVGPREADKFRMVHLPDGRRLRPGDHCLDAGRYAITAIPALHEEQPPQPARTMTALDEMRILSRRTRETGTVSRRRTA